MRNKQKLKIKYVTWSERAHCYHGELTDDGERDYE